MNISQCINGRWLESVMGPGTADLGFRRHVRCYPGRRHLLAPQYLTTQANTRLQPLLEMREAAISWRPRAAHVDFNRITSGRSKRC